MTNKYSIVERTNSTRTAKRGFFYEIVKQNVGNQKHRRQNKSEYVQAFVHAYIFILDKVK